MHNGTTFQEKAIMRNGGDNQFGNIENGNSRACQAFDYNSYKAQVATPRDGIGHINQKFNS